MVRMSRSTDRRFQSNRSTRQSSSPPAITTHRPGSRRRSVTRSRDVERRNRVPRILRRVVHLCCASAVFPAPSRPPRALDRREQRRRVFARANCIGDVDPGNSAIRAVSLGRRQHTGVVRATGDEHVPVRGAATTRRLRAARSCRSPAPMCCSAPAERWREGAGRQRARTTTITARAVFALVFTVCDISMTLKKCAPDPKRTSPLTTRRATKRSQGKSTLGGVYRRGLYLSSNSSALQRYSAGPVNHLPDTNAGLRIKKV